MELWKSVFRLQRNEVKFCCFVTKREIVYDYSHANIVNKLLLSITQVMDWFFNQFHLSFVKNIYRKISWQNTTKYEKRRINGNWNKNFNII